MLRGLPNLVESAAQMWWMTPVVVCSGTHTGDWLGHPPTGRQFRRVPEVYFFAFTDSRISKACGLEDTYGRLRQLGLT